MEEKQLKKTLREELKDITKTLNRLYEDREDILSIKETVKDLTDQIKSLAERVWKLEKNLRADLQDHKEELEKTASSVEGALTEVKEMVGGDLTNE